MRVESFEEKSDFDDDETEHRDARVDGREVGVALRPLSGRGHTARRLYEFDGP
jgi:hypothetical protein